MARPERAISSNATDLTFRAANALRPSRHDVQVIWGRNDRILPVAHAEVLTASLPAHIMADAGHLPHMEKAAAVNAQIRRFITV